MLGKSRLILLISIVLLLLSIKVGSGEPLPCNSLPESSGKENKPYKAWIVVEHENSCLKIKAFCFNNTSEDEVLRYKLRARKSGKSGRANILQAGPVYIPSQEKKLVSQLSIGVCPQDYCWIKLELYKGEKLVAEASLSYPPLFEVYTSPKLPIFS